MRRALAARFICLLAAAAAAVPRAAAQVPPAAPAPLASRNATGAGPYVVCVSRAPPLSDCRMDQPDKFSGEASRAARSTAAAAAACPGRHPFKHTHRCPAPPPGYDVEVWRMMAVRLDPPLVEGKDYVFR